MVPCGMGGVGGMGDDYAVYNTSGDLVPSTYVSSSTPAASGPSWWQSLITGAAGTAEKILVAQNQTKGVYTQTSPSGTVTYVQPAGNTANIFGASSTGITGTGTASSGMGLVLIAGAGLLLVFMMAKGR